MCAHMPIAMRVLSSQVLLAALISLINFAFPPCLPLDMPISSPSDDGR
eukprot:SAG31_NODE_5274_length_2638_cov_1.420244_3_plen_47_part_01